MNGYDAPAVEPHAIEDQAEELALGCRVALLWCAEANRALTRNDDSDSLATTAPQISIAR